MHSSATEKCSIKEQLMQGIGTKNLKGTIPTALESNETLRNIVMMSAAGEIFMNVSKFQESVLRGEKFAGDADIENLLKQGKPEEIQAMQNLLGLGDLHNVNPDAFNRKIAELEASGKLDELYNKYKAKTASTGAINAGENASFASESANINDESANSALESVNFVTDEKNRFALTNDKETLSLQTNENNSSKNAKNADKRLHIDKKNDIMISEKQINTQEFDHGTNRTNEFRRIQEESRGMSDEERSSYQNGSKKLDIEKRERLAVAFEKELSTSRSGESFNQSSLVNHRTGKNITMLENVDGSLFHDIFEVAKKYLHNGELVDLHDNYDNATCYISNDGLCGFAIEGNGNLVSVFNLGENGFLDTISEYVKNKGATHLDCYNSDIQPLTLMYERKLGFKTASIMDYNMEYDHDNIAKNHNMPKVAFMVNTNENVETKTFSKDEYDAAVAYQQSFVKDNKSNNSRTDLKETRKALPNEKKASSETENTQKKAGGEPGKSMTVIESATFAKENVPEYSQLNADDQARVRRLIRQAKASGFTDKQTRAYARVSARSGIDIVFDKERLYRGNGKYADGLYSPKQNKIFVNPEGSRSPARLLIHELTHALYNDRQSRVILDRGAKNLTEDQKKEIWNKYFPDAEYNENNIIFKDELSSHYTEALLDDDALLEKLCNDNPTLKDKILSFFKKAITGYSDEPNLSREAKKLYKRYKTLFDSFSERNQYNTGTEKGGERFALREIVGESGKEYGIGVYLDSELLTNLSDDERVEMVKEYVKELGGSLFTAYDTQGNEVDVHLVESNKKFKNKSGKRVPVNKDLTNYLNSKVKQEAIALIDELIIASNYRGSEPATHPHDWVDNNGRNDWDVWTTYIQDKENTVWEAKLRIANSTNGEKILYDIFPIEKVEQSRTMDTSTTISVEQSAISDTSATNNSISQNSEKSTENAKKVSTNSGERAALPDSAIDNDGDERFATSNDSKITSEMSDSERAEILKTRTITAPVYEGQADVVITQKKAELEKQKELFGKSAVVEIAEKLGLINSKISFDDVNVQILLSKGNIEESITKEATPEQIAKLLPILDKTAKESIVIERHNNRYYHDTDTVYFDNLLGAYIDGDNLIPVRFGLKHSRTGNTTLYVVVNQNEIPLKNLSEIKKDRGHSDPSPDFTESDNPLRSVEYSISQIFSFVNSKDLLRYIPDDFLNINQKNIKDQAVRETEEYTNEKNNEKYSKYIEKGNFTSAKQMLYAKAKDKGYIRSENNTYENLEGNVKLAEITYDDEGNLIPISKRLDSSNSDRRYALPDTDTDTVDTSDSVGKKRTQYKASIKERIFTAADSIYIDTVDELYGVTKYLTKVGKIKDAASAVQAVRASAKAAETMLADVQYDIFSDDGKKLGDGLSKIIKPITVKGEKITNSFNEYLLHWLNIDRMSLEERSLAELEGLKTTLREDIEKLREVNGKLAEAKAKKQSMFSDSEVQQSLDKTIKKLEKMQKEMRKSIKDKRIELAGLCGFTVKNGKIVADFK